MPIGLMIFAWTSYTHVHWIVSVLAIVPFGFSLAAVFLSMTVSVEPWRTFVY